MISSVLFTGDAGGWRYICENLRDDNKYCCSGTKRFCASDNNNSAPKPVYNRNQYKPLKQYKRSEQSEQFQSTI